MGPPVVHQTRWPAPLEDETLARPALTGALAHLAISAILRDPQAVRACTAGDGWARAVAEADRLLYPLQMEDRAHRLTVAAAVTVYFTCLLPPPGWQFAAADVRLGRSRPDVLWRGAGGRILLDEIKTGRRATDLRATADQAARHLLAGQRMYGDRVLGVRVHSTTIPASSWLLMSDGKRIPGSSSGLLPGLRPLGPSPPRAASSVGRPVPRDPRAPPVPPEGHAAQR